jgi:hypothetical protein
MHSLTTSDGTYPPDIHKREYVLKMFRHSWKLTTADYITPINGKQLNYPSSGSLLILAVNSLSTLYVMGLEQDYSRTKKLVLEKLKYNLDYNAPVEQLASIMGGLLSAYDLEKDKRLLFLANDLIAKMYYAFPNDNFPSFSVNLKSGIRVENTLSVSFYVSFALELQYISDQLKFQPYSDMSIHSFEKICKFHKPITGLYPRYLNSTRDGFYLDRASYSVSQAYVQFYQFFWKIWQSTDKRRFKQRYEESAQAILENHLVTTQQQTFIVDVIDSSKSKTFDVSSCGLAGILAWGAMQKKTGNWTFQLHAASEMMETCYRIFFQSANGLGGQTVHLEGGKFVFDDASVNLEYTFLI